MLFITFDEDDGTHTTGCTPCHDGSAGGKIGEVVISQLAKKDFTSSWQGDHHSFLHTLEEAYGLPSLKSRAAGATAAATVHDGDRGVTSLTDVWLATSGTAGAATSISSARRPALTSVPVDAAIAPPVWKAVITSTPTNTSARVGQVSVLPRDTTGINPGAAPPQAVRRAPAVPAPIRPWVPAATAAVVVGLAGASWVAYRLFWPA